MYFEKTDHGLWSGWQETKTGHRVDIPFFLDAKDFTVDVIHALAVYVISACDQGHLCDNANPDEPNWLFPQFSSIAEEGCSAKVSQILEELEKRGSVDGLRKFHKSHGLRAGASDDLAMNELVDVVSIISRGNW